MEDKEIQRRLGRPFWGLAKYLKPASWYLLLVLGIPLLKRIVERDFSEFGEYALLVLGACLGVLGAICLGKMVRGLGKEPYK